MSKQDLLFEIGCEELPVDYIAPAQRQLLAAVESKLNEARLTYTALDCDATPRRLVLRVRGLSAAQPDLEKEVQGPTAALAYAADKTLTPAGEGFLRKYGLTAEQVEVRTGRLLAQVRETGKPARELLPDILSAAVNSLAFPKSMRWEVSQARFARPIRWLVALLSDEVIPVVFGDVTAGRITRSHPLHSVSRLEVKSAADYAQVLEQGWVVLSVAKRREALKQLLAVRAAESGGRLVEDEELLDMVVMMAEKPGVVAGGFKPAYLHIAREIIVTAMREHQRYFAVEDAQGKLLPCFLAVYDNPLADPVNIRPGCERVLEARLKDAEFFFREDMKKPLASLVPELERVLWIKGLGSLLDKTKRLETLSEWLAAKLEPSAQATAKAAAHLAKADLITNMVQEKEFTSLQGIMGTFYAAAQGAPEAVAQAIREQYQPRVAGDACPRTAGGRMLALADKLDNLVGCWGAGLIPTGAKDPYALRRAAQGIVSILLEAVYRISLTEMVLKAAKGFSQFKEKGAEIAAPVQAFILGRMETELANRQYRPDEIQALLAVWADDLGAVAQKAEMLRTLRQEPGFADQITTFSRVVNILPKNTPRAWAPEAVLPAILPEFFQVEVEKELYRAAEQAHKDLNRLLAAGNFSGAFKRLTELLPLIDRFFTDVLVMDQDEAVKTNRLNLLLLIARLLWTLADFSRLVISA
ncbi:MAG: glycine--tRNA ligase subunit beta [Candidatus Firestonebacteria bacterium]|nr:glycine--tRNA ligase subunit beta [Candidatus Firestonebacteria bacterium]